jgi:serine/threonine-protein kinase
MQYVDGRNTSQLVLDAGRPLDWRSAVRIVRSASRGLQAVHDRGIIHRDIKPANIMVSREGRILLMDFGLVHTIENESGRRERSVVGTPAFMSPEQCLGDDLDGSSDVYSMGCTLYYLLTGKGPYRGASREIMRQVIAGCEAPAVATLNPEVPRALSELISRTIAARSSRPFRRADDFAAELGRLLKSDSSKGGESDNTVVSAGETAANSAFLAPVEPAADPIVLRPCETPWRRVTAAIRRQRGACVVALGGLALAALSGLVFRLSLR